MVLCLVCSISARAEMTDINGKITAVIYGEFDPYLMGDACIVQIQKENGAKIGLVTSFEDCDDNAGEYHMGRQVSIAKETLSYVKSRKKEALLNSILPSHDFFVVPAGTIENGLAD